MTKDEAVLRLAALSTWRCSLPRETVNAIRCRIALTHEAGIPDAEVGAELDALADRLERGEYVCSSEILGGQKTVIEGGKS